MTHVFLFLAVILLTLQGGSSRLASEDHNAEAHPESAAASLYGEFVGSTPCDGPIRLLLGIPRDIEAELIEWKLSLYQDSKTQAPANYELAYRYGPAVPQRPGLGSNATALARRGQWRIAKGTKANPAAVVYELDEAMAFFQVSPNLLHVLNRDRSLMVGGGGWSYTLNRSEASEPRVDPSLEPANTQSRTVPPADTGPSVFGIFDGRTPCQGIARELNVHVHSGCAKSKWRITLYQDPRTGNPTNYRIESSIHRSRSREGTWTMVKGSATDPNAIVYRLSPESTEAPLLLLRGDENVLFFMDHNRRPLTAHAQFSYTLNRRQPAPSS